MSRLGQPTNTQHTFQIGKQSDFSAQLCTMLPTPALVLVVVVGFPVAVPRRVHVATGQAAGVERHFGVALSHAVERNGRQAGRNAIGGNRVQPHRAPVREVVEFVEYG